MRDNWEKELDEILEGIDQTENDSDSGWWETSEGVRFGVEVKAKIKALITELENQHSQLLSSAEQLRLTDGSESKGKRK